MYCFNQQHNCTKINDKDYILNALLLYLIKIYAIIIVILNYILVIEIVTVILITIF